MTAVLSNESTLVRVPAPMLMEAPSSWLTRAALAQAATLKEFLDYLGLPRGGNLDLEFLKLDEDDLLKRTKTSTVPMQATRIVLARAARLYQNDCDLFLSDEGNGQFSYCPDCFREQRTPYVPIHWRFAGWRYCPVHLCLMQTGCRHCGSPSLLPSNLLTAGPKGDGVAWLSHCSRCDKALASAEPVRIKLTGSGAISPIDAVVLSNGRAMMSALYHGRVLLQRGGQNRGLGELAKLDRQGLIPRGQKWPREKEVLKRATHPPPEEFRTILTDE